MQTLRTLTAIICASAVLFVIFNVVDYFQNRQLKVTEKATNEDIENGFKSIHKAYSDNAIPDTFKIK